jgi:hypothetical protein
MARRQNWRALSEKRAYTVDEARRALGVTKATVRRWIKAGLPVVEGSWPRLLLGSSIRAFLHERQPERRKCQLDECYCLKCRCPQPAAFREAEIVAASLTSVNIRALCPCCARLMHKRVSLANFPALSHVLRLRVPHALRHLIDTTSTCLHVHFEPEPEGHAKTPS